MDITIALIVGFAIGWVASDKLGYKWTIKATNIRVKIKQAVAKLYGNKKTNKRK